MITVSGKQLFEWRKQALEKARSQTADASVREVDWLLQQATNLDSLTLRLESFQDYSTIAISHSLPELTRLWQQRLENHLPVQYIVGQTNWRSWQLKVSPAVLIPRPETELVIEIIKQANLSWNDDNHLVDLGTGSGAIALGLAASFPQATIHAVDISLEALEIARQNATINNLATKIQFYLGSWWNPLTHLKGKVTAIVSNPPYIPTSELPHLQPEVFRHEPHLALDGGGDGLAAIRHLVAVSPQYLHSGGVFLVEMMAGQSQDVLKMLDLQGDYYKIEVIPDLSGIDRFVLAYRK